MRLLVNHRIFEDRNPNKKRNMLRHIFLRRQQLTAQEWISGWENLGAFFW